MNDDLKKRVKLLRACIERFMEELEKYDKEAYDELGKQSE